MNGKADDGEPPGQDGETNKRQTSRAVLHSLGGKIHGDTWTFSQSTASRRSGSENETEIEEPAGHTAEITPASEPSDDSSDLPGFERPAGSGPFFSPVDMDRDRQPTRRTNSLIGTENTPGNADGVRPLTTGNPGNTMAQERQ